MRDTFDVIIIGAGVMGLSAAFQIARRSTLRVCVLEQGLGLGEGSSGASSAVCRFKYSLDDTVRLARDGIQAYQNWPEFLELQDPLARFHGIGVLWLGGEGRASYLDDPDRLDRLGVRATLIDDDEARRQFPAINPCVLSPDFSGGEEHVCRGGALHLVEQDGGYMDPVDVLQDLASACRKNKVDIRLQTRVAKVMIRGGRVSGVVLAGGDEIHAAMVVNCAGPWCNHLLEELGLNLPWTLSPARIQVVHVDRPEGLEGDLPVCVDPEGGIYFRPQNRGQQIVLGSVREEDEQEFLSRPEDLNPVVDDLFSREKLLALQHRVPAFQYKGQISGYCGIYTVNREDFHPIVGQTPLPGFLVANGFSGHGFKLAPAIGSLLAQHIAGTTTSFETDVDPAFLACDRAPHQLTVKNVLA